MFGSPSKLMNILLLTFITLSILVHNKVAKFATFETYDQSDYETCPDQKNIMTKTNTKTKTMTNTFREHIQRAIIETCDLWDI